MHQGYREESDNCGWSQGVPARASTAAADGRQITSSARRVTVEGWRLDQRGAGDATGIGFMLDS